MRLPLYPKARRALVSQAYHIDVGDKESDDFADKDDINYDSDAVTDGYDIDFTDDIGNDGLFIPRQGWLLEKKRTGP